MVTVNKITGVGEADMELKGLSTDSKPTGEFSGQKIAVNSLFMELDTGDVYYYTGSDWAKVGG
jgi:hypothetical protein